MHVPQLLGGLGQRFGRLWLSYSLANLSDGIVLIGLPLIAVQLTRSPVLVAGTMVALTLPWFLFGLLAGALADRLDRRWLMIYASVPRVVVLTLLVLAAWQGMLSMALLYAGAFVLGTAEALFDTSGQALLPMLVDRHLLRRANGRLFGTRVVMNEFVGTPLAGALVGLAVTAALLAPAVLYLAAPLALLLLKGGYRPEREGGSPVLAEVGNGLIELWRNGTVRALAGLAGVANLANEAFMAVFVLYAVGAGSALRLPESAYGLLLAAGGIGATLGALAVERLERHLGTRTLLATSTIAMAAVFAIPAAFANRYAAAGALFLAGISTAVFSVISLSLRQELVPEGMLGRVSASFRLIAYGTRPVGGILGGVVADAIGLRPLFFLCAGTVLLIIPLVGRVHIPERDGR